MILICPFSTNVKVREKLKVKLSCARHGGVCREGGEASLNLHVGVPYFYTFYTFRENNSYSYHCCVPHCGLFR